ncbi:hydrolase 1, exosortase A system-associated [Bowmanella pacifica]|uniref:Hydrolase 1, exosortase A system-associated n=1 Tax=Bowmanella pacifica TaxID=502051 RepID=A0A918DGV8_9ALTE|nr:hydrolase 1, exosortase A system-associated [Bowmanella pacifica]GGO63755.1 hydrolase 1, exosortase A system-associated [Bowmanella pacifica]
MTKEVAQVFSVNDDKCVGIFHAPLEQDSTIGVLIVVGGPQYRVGSHRQFVQLSRALATAGIASFRFDYRGMGDSAGNKQGFEQIDTDIGAALNQFALTSGLQRFVIWGLCDAASAAMIYACQDRRVTGLVLMNPWLKSQSAQGQTMLKHYYLQRLLSKAFWKKLLRGGVNLKASVADAKGFAKDAAATSTAAEESYQARMLKGMQAYQDKICLILSGNDLTAREFEQVAFSDKNWKKALKNKVSVKRIKDADHTFSNRSWKQQVELLTIDFVASL